MLLCYISCFGQFVGKYPQSVGIAWRIYKKMLKIYNFVGCVYVCATNYWRNYGSIYVL